jgi:hypothetical protein
MFLVCVEPKVTIAWMWGCWCVAGAAAGGASVRGDEVKEQLLGLVGRDKARLEACFALEQVVFRAVLAGQ